MTHDWQKHPHMWFCPTCRSCLVPEAAERFGMSWPPAEVDVPRLTDIEYKGPCWPKAPVETRELERWKSHVSGQTYAARIVLAEMQRQAGQYAPDPVP